MKKLLSTIAVGTALLVTVPVLDAGTLSFNGSGTRVDLNNPQQWPTSAMTIEFWIKTTQAEGVGIVSYASSASANNILIWMNGDGTIQVSRASTINSTFSVNDGQWHHVAVSWRNSDGLVELYMDGTLRESSPSIGTGTSITGGGYLMLGQEQDAIGGSLDANQAYLGELDEVRVWDTNLAGNTIASLYNKPLAGDEANLVLYWPFDEDSGIGVADLSGKNPGALAGGTQRNGLRNAIPINVPEIQFVTDLDASSGNLSARVLTGGLQSSNQFQFGPGSQAVTFDGLGSFATVPNGPDLSNQSFTIEFWAKRNRINVSDFIFSQGTPTLNNLLHIGWRSNNRITFAFYQNDLNANVYADDLNWHHWAFTYDSTTKIRRVFKDGVLAVSDTSPANFVGGGALQLGRYFANTSLINGAVSMDEVRVWTGTVLDGATIQDWMFRELDNSHPNDAELDGYWKFEEAEGNTFIDSSGSGRDGVLIGNVGRLAATRPHFTQTTTEVEATGNEAVLNLDGFDDHVTLPEGIWFDGGAFTVEGWVYPRKFSNWARILETGVFAGGDNVVFAFTSGTSGQPAVNIRQGTGGPSTVTSEVALPLNAWSHVAFTFDGNNTARVFVNGVQTGVGPMVAPMNVNRPLTYIGRSVFGDPDANAAFDDIRIWDTELDASAIQWGMNRSDLTGHPEGTADIAARWLFDETSGDTVVDSSGNGLDGTLANGAERLQALPASETIALAQETVHTYRSSASSDNGSSVSETRTFSSPSPISGTALELDGANTMVVVTEKPELRVSSAMTFETWFRWDGQGGTAGGAHYLLNKEGEYEFAIFSDGTFRWAIDNSSPNWAFINTGFKPEIGTWTHIAFTYNGSEARTFANGQLVHARAASGNITDQNTALDQLQIGHRQAAGLGGEYFSGAMEEVRLWSIARTDDEIAESFNQFVAPNSPGLVAYYQFNEATGNTVHDASPTGADGNIFGTPTFIPSPVPLLKSTPVALAASGISEGSATLNGEVYGNGQDETSYWFEFADSLLPIPGSSENRVEYSQPGGNLSGTVNQHSWVTTPIKYVEPFDEINLPTIPLAGWPGGPNDDWRARYLGKIYVPVSGLYTFFTESDDGSLLYINDALVVNNDGAHLMQERSGSVYLEQGRHHFDLRHVEIASGGGLIASWAGPDFAKEVIPASAFLDYQPVWSGSTPPATLAANGGKDSVTADLSGLAGAQSHHYRLVSSNINGVAYSDVSIFEMPHPGQRSGIAFNGTTSAFLRANNVSVFPQTNITVEFWIRGPALFKDDTYLSYAVGSSYNELLLISTNSSTSVSSIIDNTAPTLDINDVDYHDSTWHHFAWRWRSSDGALDLFRDGTNVFSGNLKQGASLQPGGTLVIGQDQDTLGGSFQVGQSLTAELDEYRIWDDFRSDEEIAGNRHLSLRGDEDGLAVYYRMDEGAGSIAQDSGPNGVHATLGSGTTFINSSAPLFAPDASIQSAAPVLATSATLNGSANAGGANAFVQFEYGPTIAYGSTTTPQPIGNGIFTQTVMAGLEDLQPGTTYYSRLVAWNQYGTNYSVNATFTTLVLGCGWPISTKLTGGKSELPVHVTDPMGNVFAAGTFSGTASFAGTLLPEGGYGTNAFVGKLARGADWSWAVNIPATDSVIVNGIALDADQNIHVTGQLKGTATFGNTVLDASTDGELFVAKISADGSSWLWAKGLGGAGAHSGNGLVIDGSGNIYITGSFIGNISTAALALSSVNDAVLVAALDSDGEWLWGQGVGSTGSNAGRSIVIDASDNLYVAGEFTGVDVEFSNGSPLTSRGDTDLFVAKLNTSGTWLLTRRAGGDGPDLAQGLTIDAAGNPYLLASFDGNADFDNSLVNLNSVPSDNPKVFVAKLNPEASVVWYAQGGEGIGTGIAVDGLDHIYITGQFSLSTTFGANQVFSAGNSDVFMAQVSIDSGEWGWLQTLGATGSERGGSISVDPLSSIVVSGSFQNTVEIGYVLLSSPNERDIFFARLDPEQVYEHNTYTIGQAVPVPADAQDPGRTDGGGFGQPVITILEKDHADSDQFNSFVWSQSENKLYAVRPVTAVLKWPLTSNITNLTKVATCVTRTVWPREPQFHVADVPVELEPSIEGFPYRYFNLAFKTAETTKVDAGTKTFNAVTNGWSVIQFLNTGGLSPNPALHSSVFEVVKTVQWDSETLLNDGVPATIGSAITRSRHNDPSGKNGFSFFDLARIDSTGNDRAYNKALRTGPIIPVNKDTSDLSDDLVVVWFRTNHVTGIAWPDDPVRYLAQWPTDVDDIVIASQLGSGTLTTLEYPNKRVYNQPNADDGGYNPNEEHALIVGDILFSLRNDLNGPLNQSEPFTLLKYQDPQNLQWSMKVFRVVATNQTYRFAYTGQAGSELQLPRPLSSLALCGESNTWISGPGYKDHNGTLYARAAGPDNTGTNIVVQYWYPLQSDFFMDLNLDGEPDSTAGDCIPWLSRLDGIEDGVPVNVNYSISWPADVPTLQVGETLLGAKFGLPSVVDFASARLVHDQANPLDNDAINSLVRIFDPLSERVLQLNQNFQLPPEVATSNQGGRLVFTDLPFAIRSRLSYNDLDKTLSFVGFLDEDIRYGGPDNPLLLINVMSPREQDRIKQLAPANTAFAQAVDDLYHLTRNPNGLDLDGDEAPDQELLIGLDYGTNEDGSTNFNLIVHEKLGDGPKAMTAALGTGTGYITLAENDDSALGSLPVTLHIIRVDDGPFRGDLKVIYPDNVFDEKLTLRHSADFAGEPQNFEFEWFYKSDEPGFDRTLLPDVGSDGEIDELNGWIRYTAVNQGINGANDITFGDGGTSSLLTISDNWVICRYRGFSQTIFPENGGWSEWVGAIGGGEAQLAEGWVKRVVFGLNPFEARTKEFHETETVTFASMIQQAGARWEGPIAFNPGADNLNKIGLIEAYQTVLNRGRDLSIDAVPPANFAPANNALLLAAGRLADFYMLLGNEAFADAADPTIGFSTGSGQYGTLAPSIFAFQNQLDSLLEEELALLRGRDDSSATVRAAPAYNRVFWNFTKDQGEVAYAQAYNVTDQNTDGSITAEDGRIMFPQAHGDAWGHYLTAIKTYYSLIQDNEFDWTPRTESILLAGVPVEVDYLDERKFARAAAAKAKTGAEIVDLTYRSSYVDDPAGQYQGYKDTDADRAWGFAEWANRAGTGAYLDWVTANALLPANDPNPEHVGLEKIDRQTVREIGEISAGYDEVQSQVDKADAGLNPLGLAKGVVPFDIDPGRIDDGETHFEQIYERATSSMKNAVTVFNHANQLSQSLRQLQDTVNQFSQNAEEQERDYKNRMIEIFGYPYSGDIGPGKTYPSGYDGPDIYHYMYVDAIELNGDTAPASETFTGYFSTIESLEDEDESPYFSGDVNGLQNPDISPDGILAVEYPKTASDFGFVAPASWQSRRAPGEIQIATSELVQGDARLKQAILNYDALIKEIGDAVELLEARHGLREETLNIRDIANGKITTWKIVGLGAKIAVRGAQVAKGRINDIYKVLIESMPKTVGLATDAMAPARGAAFATQGVSRGIVNTVQVLGEVALEGSAAAIEAISKQAALDIEKEQYSFEIQQRLKELEQLIRKEPILRAAVLTQAEKVSQTSGQLQSTIQKGLRVAAERIAFRKRTAGETQASRYQDMTFRVFRNDAIQKYRAQFDLAARYAYLAAIAYDYETQLLGGSTGSGRDFLTDIVKQRSLGQFENGNPIAGRHGLADPLARLSLNFDVLKGQLGFNNPQTETGRFSLRNELLRISDTSDEDWRNELREHIVPDLWSIPEFRRYCRPFAPESAGAQPGIVIRFPTTVTFGLNYFGWPLGGGDSAYDSSVFATKVRSAGVWFSNYDGSGLSVTPRVYLVPVGSDILRSPSGNNLEIREWRVVDQKLPVPFPIGFNNLNDSAFIPINDTLSDTFADIRRFSSFRAYHDSGFFNPNETVSDSRLIGRSVWNTDWMLIIPGGTFLFDSDQGLDTFIDSVSDIKIFFQTYAYSGN